jgi:hypothetical protein
LTSIISHITIAGMSLEANKKPKSPDPLGEIVKFFSTKEGRLKWDRKCLRNKARGRLDFILDENYNKGTEKFLAQMILKTYGYVKDEIDTMEFSTAHRHAMRLVASDLLITEFYDANGNSTDFAKENYPGVDPKEYVVIPTAWTATHTILESKVGISSQKGNSTYAGYISSGVDENDEDRGDIVAKYARVFGKENIIALPFSLGINSSSVYIAHQEDFVPPYGGKFASRLVFLSRVTTLDLPSPQ